MFIPWVTYTVFLIISIVNSKNLINWLLLFFNLLLLFWHISADLVTKKSHQRLMRGWGAFTILAAICFLILIIFQIVSLEQISSLSSTKDFVDGLPLWIVENYEIIGLVNYTHLGQWKFAVKFLAYVAYFNLSVITRRQFIRSSKKVKAYETNTFVPLEEEPEDQSSDEEDKPLEVKFSLVFLVYKLKWFWPFIDFISWHTFTLLSLAVVILALHWKLSAVFLLYIVILMFYYILLPFFLQPKPQSSGRKLKEGVSTKEMKELWATEDSHAKRVMLNLRNKMVVSISFFTIICI